MRNSIIDLVDRLEEHGEIFIIRPGSTLNVGRAERNKDKLYAVYDQGYNDASACYKALCAYLD